MECWWAQPSSHDGSVHVHSRARSVSGTQVMAASWDFADIQLDGLVRSGLEWNVGGRSLRHMTEVCTCILARGRLAEHR